jgi:hypothetical protein
MESGCPAIFEDGAETFRILDELQHFDHDLTCP